MNMLHLSPPAEPPAAPPPAAPPPAAPSPAEPPAEPFQRPKARSTERAPHTPRPTSRHLGYPASAQALIGPHRLSDPSRRKCLPLAQLLQPQTLSPPHRSERQRHRSATNSQQLVHLRQRQPTAS